MGAMYGKVGNVLRTTSRLCLVSTLAIAGVAALTVSTGEWGARSAQAAASLPLSLTLTGPHNADVKQPLSGIIVRLVNPGPAVPDSRLRLFIHDEVDRELRTGDIKIDVKEGNVWKEVQVEAIDGGVMGAIGTEKKSHNERHKRGGFVINGKANKVWQLRVTFRLAGRYSMVVAVSPDNGSRHLAQPASLNVEVL